MYLMYNTQQSNSYKCFNYIKTVWFNTVQVDDIKDGFISIETDADPCGTSLSNICVVLLIRFSKSAVHCVPTSPQLSSTRSEGTLQTKKSKAVECAGHEQPDLCLKQGILKSPFPTSLFCNPCGLSHQNDSSHLVVRLFKSLKSFVPRPLVSMDRLSLSPRCQLCSKSRRKEKSAQKSDSPTRRQQRLSCTCWMAA